MNSQVITKKDLRVEILKSEKDSWYRDMIGWKPKVSYYDEDNYKCIGWPVDDTCDALIHKFDCQIIDNSEEQIQVGEQQKATKKDYTNYQPLINVKILENKFTTNNAFYKRLIGRTIQLSNWDDNNYCTLGTIDLHVIKKSACEVIESDSKIITASLKIEAIDLIQFYNLNYNLGNVVKIICDLKDKGLAQKNDFLQECIFYIEREITRINEKKES